MDESNKKSTHRQLGRKEGTTEENNRKVRENIMSCNNILHLSKACQCTLHI
jgi:hypothetical protein